MKPTPYELMRANCIDVQALAGMSLMTKAGQDAHVAVSGLLGPPVPGAEPPRPKRHGRSNYEKRNGIRHDDPKHTGRRR